MLKLVFDASLAGFSQIYEFMAEFLFGGFLPAFLISGALKVFVKERSITQNLGPNVNPIKSYFIASIAGMLFTACSCGVIPLFASIFRHGAGIGPAMVFLTTGPAVNFLLIVMTFQIFGAKMAIYRTSFAILHGFIMGVIFTLLYRHEDKEKMLNQGKILVNNELITDKEYNSLTDTELDEEYIPKPRSTVIGLFTILIALMFVGQIPNNNTNFKLYLFIFTTLVLIVYTKLNFAKDEYLEWLSRTGHFIFKILKPLFIGLFIIGVVKFFVSIPIITKYFGHNDLPGCCFASIIGAIMYFGSCVSVVIVKFLMDFGMAPGPALALFLSGPTVSFPSMCALITIMGYKKTTIFALIIVILSALAGLIYTV